eukprot:Hpha_TRINITY_DN14209_c0_g2::TRINITY_DN14209_c0_g2_i2::g.22395::m.22395
MPRTVVQRQTRHPPPAYKKADQPSTPRCKRPGKEAAWSSGPSSCSVSPDEFCPASGGDPIQSLLPPKISAHSSQPPLERVGCPPPSTSPLKAAAAPRAVVIPPHSPGQPSEADPVFSVDSAPTTAAAIVSPPPRIRPVPVAPPRCSPSRSPSARTGRREDESERRRGKALVSVRETPSRSLSASVRREGSTHSTKPVVEVKPERNVPSVILPTDKRCPDRRHHHPEKAYRIRSPDKKGPMTASVAVQAGDVSASDEKLRRLHEELARCRSDFEARLEEQHSSSQAELRVLREAVDDAERRAEDSREQLERTEDERRELSAELEVAREEVELQRERGAALAEEVERKAREVEEATRAAEEATKTAEQAGLEAEALQSEVRATAEAEGALLAERDELRVAVEEGQRALASLERDATAVGHDYDATARELKEERRRCAELQAECEALQAERDEVHSSQHASARELKEERRRCAELQAECDALQAERDELQREMSAATRNASAARRESAEARKWAERARADAAAARDSVHEREQGLRAEADDLATQNAALLERLDAFRSECASLRDESELAATEFSHQLSGTRRERDELLEELEAAKDALRSNSNKKDSVSESLRDLWCAAVAGNAASGVDLTVAEMVESLRPVVAETNRLRRWAVDVGRFCSQIVPSCEEELEPEGQGDDSVASTVEEAADWPRAKRLLKLLVRSHTKLRGRVSAAQRAAERAHSAPHPTPRGDTRGESAGRTRTQTWQPPSGGLLLRAGSPSVASTRTSVQRAMADAGQRTRSPPSARSHRDPSNTGHHRDLSTPSPSPKGGPPRRSALRTNRTDGRALEGRRGVGHERGSERSAERGTSEVRTRSVTPVNPLDELPARRSRSPPTESVSPRPIARQAPSLERRRPTSQPTRDVGQARSKPGSLLSQTPTQRRQGSLSQPVRRGVLVKSPSPQDFISPGPGYSPPAGQSPERRFSRKSVPVVTRMTRQTSIADTSCISAGGADSWNISQDPQGLDGGDATPSSSSPRHVARERR